MTPEELLAGSELTYEIEVPQHVLHPGENGGGSNGSATKTVRLRPLNVRDLQLISRAAKESDTLVATLMVQRALVEPEMSAVQVAAMHIGLVQFLLDHVNRISGITASIDEMNGLAEAPLTKAAFVLSREFGWTPQEVGELTLGQVLLHVKMLAERGK